MNFSTYSYFYARIQKPDTVLQIRRYLELIYPWNKEYKSNELQ